MANKDHAELLMRSLSAGDSSIWNSWRAANPRINPDLSGQTFYAKHFSDLNFDRTSFAGANISQSEFYDCAFFEAELSRTNAAKCKFLRSAMEGATFDSADLALGDFMECKLAGARFENANTRDVRFYYCDLTFARLAGCNLHGSNFKAAILDRTDLSGAQIEDSFMLQTVFLGTDLRGSTIKDCFVYGVSVWDVVTDEHTVQSNLTITTSRTNGISVDNLVMAQFMYLLIHNPNLRTVLDTMNSKIVLILGAFGADRITVLQTLREQLRRFGYVPVLFDFAGPDTKTISDTVMAIASMARFVVVDISDPRCSPHETSMIASNLGIPIQAIIENGQKPWAMFRDLRHKFRYVLAPLTYEGPNQLMTQLKECVIDPCEKMAAELIASKTALYVEQRQ
jgi:uncharacterized protein YjbI with pentapeptide repeats